MYPVNRLSSGALGDFSLRPLLHLSPCSQARNHLKLVVYQPEYGSNSLIVVYFFFQVNEYQAKIKDTTRKMMALVSELSMNQAAAMKLQQQVKSKEQDLEQCYVRMERGEAPNEEAEKEWLRMVRDEARREKEMLERTEVPLVFERQ